MQARHREALQYVLEAAEKWHDVLVDEEAFTEYNGDIDILFASILVTKELLDEQR